MIDVLKKPTGGELLSSDEMSRVIKETVERVRPIIERDASISRSGIQYVVEAPPIYELRTSAKESEERNSLALPEEFFPDLSSMVSQNIGLLNVTGLDTNELIFDYHSESGGRDFVIRVGNRVRFENITPQEAFQVFPNLLGTLEDRKNVGSHNRRTIFLSSFSSRDYFDREGNRIVSPGQSKESGDTKKLQPSQ